MKRLSRTTVGDIPKRPVRVVQFGEGNFLRGFLDWMVDILNEKTSFNGNIQIVQPLPQGMGDAINSQDGLYHVLLEGVEKGNKVQTTRLITSVEGVLNPYINYKDFLRMGENPEMEFIVSNTTEAGITFDHEDHNFDGVPKTFPGKLTALLHHRFCFFGGNPPGAIYVLPCELIEANGETLRECVINYAALWSLGESFTTWLQKSVIFYNTLVDRIVTGFPKNTISETQNRLGFVDQLVVKSEPFHLWVIEGPSQIEHKLQFSKAGLNVAFTKDLSPYRTRKVRILNGAHTAMVPIAYLNGFSEVRDVVEDEEMGEFLNHIIFKEIIPTLDMPEKELKSYAEEVLDRFRNPFIKHLLMDISLNSISKFKVRVLPSLLVYIETYEKVPEGLADSFYHLMLFYKGEFKNRKIPLRDDMGTISFFKSAWQSNNLSTAIDMVLSNESLWGSNLKENALLLAFLKVRAQNI